MAVTRRGAIAGAAGAGAAALAAVSGARGASPPATFVLVHGAWHGGWCWRDVRPRLEAIGHRVLTPTLTGMGERLHLGTAATNVATHAQDIAAVIDAEELRDVVLVGHSYGGLPISYVDHPAVRTRVYLDALLPEPGTAVFAGLAPDARKALEASLVDGFRVPPFPVAAFDVPVGNAAATAWLTRRLTTMPVGSFTTPLPPLPPSRAREVYIACTAGTLDAPKAGLAKARAAGWEIRSLAAGHDAMVTEPALTATLFASIARG